MSSFSLESNQSFLDTHSHDSSWFSSAANSRNLGIPFSRLTYISRVFSLTRWLHLVVLEDQPDFSFPLPVTQVY